MIHGLAVLCLMAVVGIQADTTPIQVISDEEFRRHRLAEMDSGLGGGGGQGFSHECAHDTTGIQRHVHDGMDRVHPQRYGPVKDETPQQPQHEDGRRMEVAATANGIRFVFSTLDLYDSTKYCTSTSDVVPDFKGATITCTTDHILTSTKRDALINDILPLAAQRLANALSIKTPVSGNLVVPSGSCSEFNVPTSHTTTGVADADYVLYVAGAPTSGTTIGWAGGCSTDQNGRLFVGRTNFSPRYLLWTGATQAERDSIMETATHEILHALGFSSSLFVNKNTVTPGPRGKPSVEMLQSPAVILKAKDYFGCSTVAGVELEDEGSSSGSHWERRVLRDDVMAPSSSYALSAITLAVIEDQGFYTADYTKAEPSKFGFQAGCGFLDEKCNTVAGGMDKFFCFDSTLKGCTYDHASKGYCDIGTSTSDLATYFQYFSDPKQGGGTFMDGCPVVLGYSNRLCKQELALTSSDLIYGTYYGNSSRCFNTTGMFQTGYSSASASTDRCLQAQCPEGTRVEIAVAGTWVQCPANGSAGMVSAPTGFTGEIYCPSADAVCDANISTGAWATPIPPPPTPLPTTTAAPPTTTASPTTQAAVIQSTAAGAPGATSAAATVTAAATASTSPGASSGATSAAVTTGSGGTTATPSPNLDLGLGSESSGSGRADGNGVLSLLCTLIALLGLGI